MVIDLPTQHAPIDLELLPTESTAQRRQPRYYAVAIGRSTGVFTSYDAVAPLVAGLPYGKLKKFKTNDEAEAYIRKYKHHQSKVEDRHQKRRQNKDTNDEPPKTVNKHPHLPAYLEYRAQHAADPSSRSWDLEDSAYDYTQPLRPDHGASWSHMAHLASKREPEPEPEPELQTLPTDLANEYVDVGPPLVPEQQHVVDLILAGRNIFYTGSAGCGKSTILRSAVRQLQQRGKRVQIVAPTNLAALNVGGITTWSYAGWTVQSMKRDIDKLMQAALGDKSWQRFDETDVLIIDEISMIENLFFERLNMVIKASRGEKYGGGPFGGMQLIVTGDFYQLSPVKPFHHCMCGWELQKDGFRPPREYKCENRNCREESFLDIDKWAFRSKAWEECNFEHVNLIQIHRQNDFKFKFILNFIRTEGKIQPQHAKILMNHTSNTEGAIMLSSLKNDVLRVNRENLDKIASEARWYKCLDTFQWSDVNRSEKALEKNENREEDGSLTVMKDSRYETHLQLKQGQRVVLLANIDPSAGLVNGAQGEIIEFKPYDKKELPKAPDKRGEDGELRGDHAKYREGQIKQFGSSNNRQAWPVVRFLNGVTRTILAECMPNEVGTEQPYCLLSRTQIPLTAGYAITIHKSQGMTLERVTVDLARAFEPSQIYVALSRAKSLQGLTVTALPRLLNLGGANEQVKEFMQTRFPKHRVTVR